MNEIIQKISNEPPVGIELITKIIEAIGNGKECIYLLPSQVSAEHLLWLFTNGFTVERKAEMHEYKICWTEKSPDQRPRLTNKLLMTPLTRSTN